MKSEDGQRLQAKLLGRSFLLNVRASLNDTALHSINCEFIRAKNARYSWLEDWWFNWAYYDFRDPVLPILTFPFHSLSHLPVPRSQST